MIERIDAFPVSALILMGVVLIASIVSIATGIWSKNKKPELYT